MLSSRAYLNTAIGAVVLIVVLIPLGVGASDSFLLASTTGAAMAIAVVGMDLMTGYAGQPNMGQGAFLAIGAYVSTALMNSLEWGFVPAAVAAIAVSGLVAAILGAGALRLASIGLAIVTFSFAFVVFTLLNGTLLGDWTGRASGMVVPTATLGPLDFSHLTHAYYVALFLLSLVLLGTYVYTHSRHGRVLMAVKRSEVLPSVMGVNVFAAKMWAMVWSSMCGAAAGVVLAQASGFVTPEAYTATFSITLLAIAAIGGLGTLVGPAAGAFLYAWLGYRGAGVSGSGLWWPLLFLLVLIFSPAGLFGLVNGAWAWLRRRSGATPAAGPSSDARVGNEDDASPDSSGSAAAAEAGRWRRLTERARPLAISGPPVLRVEDIDLKYGGVTALDSVAFEVQENRVHALIGPNGAGKTSLLDVLTGVTPPTAGDVVLDGRSLVGMAPFRRVRHGLRRSFQHATLVADLSVFANVQLAAENGHDPEIRARRGRVSSVHKRTVAALQLAGVDEATWDRPAGELNGGDQKLVDIARAFVGNPRIILLDEPTSGVTEAEVDGIAKAIHAAVDGGITVVVIDHNVEFVKAVADHVTVLDFGQVIGDGEPATVLDSPAVIHAFLGGES
ncbi:ATP-binding cassette domain-containing protein [Streptomyces sp. NPDC058424]|uniref:branched-chain amino acid ABC transporter ATP-binding protein/permease n=1 Tax=Streptomyces sp. NPDC058424 TaxID=3346491 RepID=UPI0036677BEC